MNTGLERYSDDGNLDIEASIQAIGDAMIARNKEKYGDFLKTFESIDTLLKLNLVPERKKRVELFRLTYFVCRLVDDIIDGDTQIIDVQERQKFVDVSYAALDAKKSETLIGVMIQKSLQIAEVLGIQQDYSYAITQILKSMEFDLHRIVDTHKFRSYIELQEHFHRLDIEGTIRGTALIFGLDQEEAVRLLTPLGQACRIAYTLEDLVSDSREGLYNISLEEMREFGVTEQDVENIKKGIFSGGLQNWIEQQTKDIKRLLESHHHFMQNSKIPLTFSHKKSINTFVNFLLQSWYNFLLRFKVYPSAYIVDIERILKLPLLQSM